MINPLEVLFEQTFTFRDAETGQINTWAVERATTWVRDSKRRKYVMIPLEPKNVEFIRLSNGIEQHRLQRIDQVLIDANPILMCGMPDKTMLIVDGSHRFVRAYDLGLKEIKAFIIMYSELKQFEVAIPDKLKPLLLSGFSGIR